ncbi:hypothetical protein B0H65DRAFT_539750 [Neurospora tetraspora]|uniref:Secreted protein n=1 Tax=Neurospora tetraspora TaxID=94610 RepID=A0AAE0JGB1_9PEZI|nr:hypothetical protein B0H65DRAFT_539750 [Neurospora tetraspora]
MASWPFFCTRLVVPLFLVSPLACSCCAGTREAVFLTGVFSTTGDGGRRISGRNNGRRNDVQDPSRQGMRFRPVRPSPCRRGGHQPDAGIPDRQFARPSLLWPLPEQLRRRHINQEIRSSMLFMA